MAREEELHQEKSDGNTRVLSDEVPVGAKETSTGLQGSDKSEGEKDDTGGILDAPAAAGALAELPDLNSKNSDRRSTYTIRNESRCRTSNQ